MKHEDLTPYRTWIYGLLLGASLGAALGFLGQCTSGLCPLTSTWWRGAVVGGLLGLLTALQSTLPPRRPWPTPPPESLP